jgi:hypothetical protein
VGCRGLIIEEIIEGFSSGVFTGGLIQGFGADDPGLEKIAEIGLFLVFDCFVDSFPAMMCGVRVVKAASPAAFEVGQTGGAMIDTGRLALDPGIFATIPTTQSHGIPFPFGSLNLTRNGRKVKECDKGVNHSAL